VIDPQLELRVLPYLQEVQADIGNAMAKGGARPWVDFASEGHELEPAGKFDFPALHALFSRNRSEDAYASKIQDKETMVSEITSSKLSANCLAGFERDHRARTRSRIRWFITGGVSIAKANGGDTGALRRNHLDWLGRIAGSYADTEAEA
jgi:hypothetical protein